MTHTIQLREPWRRTRAGDAASFARRFNTPTNLDADEQVWLCVDRPTHACTARLNERPLGAVAAESCGEFDITRLLAAGGNLVELQLTAPPAEPANFHGVRLEIRVKSDS